ncbi:MAG: HEAT repeat domain-containing protein [Proteobacteria bacterium]|nr:HEAT repeat domain-containing protein [Pseudomonadota bacterium]
MLSKEELLRGFVEDGVVTMPSSLEEDTHTSLYESTKRLFGSMRDGFNPHNNVLPMLPKLWDVLDDPHLQAALSTILGDNYLIHPHRHPHITPSTPDRTAPAMMQHFHKDGHAVKPRPRHREPWWLILFYYPQAVSMEYGPTGVLKGTHVLPGLTRGPINPKVLPEISSEGNELRLDDNYVQPRVTPMTCSAGTLALCHFDIGHGAMLNVTEDYRWAIKFVVMRTERPSQGERLTIPTDTPISRHLVSWLGHNPGEKRSAMALSDWHSDIGGDDPLNRVNALYSSHVVDKQSKVRDILMKEISAHKWDEASDRVLDYADASNALALIEDKSPINDLLASDRNEDLVNGCFAAGQSGEPAFAGPLVRLLQHSNLFVQRHAMSALGLLAGGDQRGAVVTALGDIAHNDEDWDIRLYAVQALIRMGRTSDLIEILKPVAQDPNTYVNAFAMEQLCRIDHPAAREAVLEPLRRQRWMDDPRYYPKPGHW